MKLIHSVIIAISLLFCIDACKKSNNTPNIPIVYPNYTELKVGNYWIYEEYSIDAIGNATTIGIFDSCYVKKDTIINGQTYFVLAGPSNILGSTDTAYQYLRDSLDYTIDNLGNIIFSSKHMGITFNTITTPNDTVISQMTDSGLSITVPSGTYTTINFQQTYKLAPQYAHYGNQRYRNARYSQNTGIVSETMEIYFGLPGTWERRLVRYHLN